MSWDELEERIAELNRVKGNLVLSNQYGMIFLLDGDNRIILNLSALLTREERMKHA